MQTNRVYLISLIAGIWFFGAPVWSKDQAPATDDACLNDHGQIISKSDKANMRSLCRKAGRDKVYMMIVTVGSLDDFQPRPLSVDRFVDDIFNDWDINYEEGKDAVLLFVSVAENEFRIVMGDNYSDGLRKRAARIIHSTLVPDFRRRKRSRGLRKTLSRLYSEVAKRHIKAQKKANQPKAKKFIMQGP